MVPEELARIAAHAAAAHGARVGADADAPQIARLSRWDSAQEFSRAPDALDPSQMLAANAAHLGHH
jgi:hypothetical protein